MSEEAPRETLALTLREGPGEDFAVSAELDALAGARGIENATLSGNELVVVFHPFIVSEEVVRRRIQEAGFRLQEERGRKRGAWRRFVDRLASENKRSLGGKPLDCCDLNKSNRPQ